MAMEVSWNRDFGVPIATLTGRIDSANSMDCHDALKSGIGPDDESLLLNMGGVTFLSSAGLRVLLMLAKKFTGPGKTFALCELKDHINEVITVSGFSQIIQIHDTQAEAISAITGTDAPAADDAADTPRPTSPPALRDPIDMAVIGDNITDVANYAIEKYEFVNTRLADNVRSEAVSAISGLLWAEVERAIELRKQTRARLFQAAETKLREVVARHAG